ncbi:hypothetical protein M422DRAFT_255121 [Sphaerobolus stellatus SS14]|uniref:Uncharacterized protein n=1 Tax=Sphaerobolus stellatus (strain SS14) TaxID=990650 RepID=A0A0C9VJL8_SPHS4|nr:hypothetical protein M422DRAFT_255121 [Sphaerobolus stellatus SS14]
MTADPQSVAQTPPPVVITPAPTAITPLPDTVAPSISAKDVLIADKVAHTDPGIGTDVSMEDASPPAPMQITAAVPVNTDGLIDIPPSGFPPSNTSTTKP